MTTSFATEHADTFETDVLQHKFVQLTRHIEKAILGQPVLIHRLLVGLLSNGHLLVEGAPGLAKTRAIKTLASGIEADFHRIQFTPDLLPSDVTGSDIYQSHTHQFQFVPGPIFHHLVLADEINRAPAKVQSALLEAMGEGQVTVGDKSYALPDLFMVMATQNPLDQEGTYPLPEAQLDRFMMHVRVDYPSKADTKYILNLVKQEALIHSRQALKPYLDDGVADVDTSSSFHSTEMASSSVLTRADLFAARQAVLQVHMSPEVEDYCLEIVEMTRYPERLPSDSAQGMADIIQVGASPRAAIALAMGAQATAWLDGRQFVSPEDVKALAPDVLRHRLLLSFSAQAKGITSQQVIEQLLQWIPMP